MAGLLDFPDPVDETSARLVAGGVVAMTTATIALDQPWLLAPLTYGFAARVLTGPTLSPLGQLATRVVSPRVPGEHRSVPGPPKRLAQGMGLAMTAAASVLTATGHKRAGYAALGALTVAAGLEAFAGICLACKAFPLLVRAGLISADACPECSDLSWHPAHQPVA